MRTCTCPHEATRNGFMRTGYNSLCPFHGKPLPEVSVPIVLRGNVAVGIAVDEAAPVAAPPAAPGMGCPTVMCADCGRVHDACLGCDYVDET